MGQGKTQASIDFMNKHSDSKFIYITPYLKEAERIKKGCPALNFVEPSNKLKEFDFKKSVHAAELIRQGKNLTTTHQAFKGYTPEMLETIRHQDYILIIDENVEVLESFDVHPSDVDMACEAGYIKNQDGVYSLTDKPYNGKALREMFTLMKSRELIRVTGNGEERMFYWLFPPSFLSSFKDVFILTYLFEGQSLCNLIKIYELPYEYISVHRDARGNFSFGEVPGYTPEYVHHMGDMIHILDNDKLNSIGDDYFALSVSWFGRDSDEVNQLKNNVYNCFNNVWKDESKGRRLWATFETAKSKVKGKGYTGSYLQFNARATNEYRDKIYLAYAANVFMSVPEKLFYQFHGIEVDEDRYALSTLVQWIWRSAIRDGTEIYLYIPSRRMRTLLQNWINSLQTKEGGDRSA